MRQVAVAAFAAVLAGCGMVRDAMIPDTRANLTKLELGMTREQVIALLGEPRSKEASDGVEYFMYRTEPPVQGRDVYGVASVGNDREVTPVAFKDGRVIGWGRNFYDSRIKADVTVRNR